MTAAPAADAAVRPAVPVDADAIGAVHARAWTASYAGLLPAAGRPGGVDARSFGDAWRVAVDAPPSPRHRVLVATATDLVTGFAAVAPAEDPDTAGDVAEVVAFEVDPAHRGAGHGSRLINAVADTARDLGFRRLVLWSPEQDEARIAFLRGAGAAPDGARRVRAAEATEGGDPSPVEWAEVRLAADLTPEPGQASATQPVAVR